ncbi:purine-rich element-binding protein gamma isoform X4 [Rhineura floridana]|uniref:purine-rich element-binding protein gamma isoform X4 n=1 Tax=Rhineura floridana TaxID=261503 RepID=UPI002AC87976|nr:purine-rich element-binding protein gamma isoform X4 [Rhineura floridana]
MSLLNSQKGLPSGWTTRGSTLMWGPTALVFEDHLDIAEICDEHLGYSVKNNVSCRSAPVRDSSQLCPTLDDCFRSAPYFETPPAIDKLQSQIFLKELLLHGSSVATSEASVTSCSLIWACPNSQISLCPWLGLRRHLNFC